MLQKNDRFLGKNRRQWQRISQLRWKAVRGDSSAKYWWGYRYW